jgi:hypothetical protein
MTGPLDDALRLADSPDWADRARAAQALARLAGGRADEALARLLDDPEDTAVSAAALEAVIERADDPSAEILFRFLATGDDDAVDHVLSFLESDWESAARAGLPHRTKAAFASGDATIAAGAREVLDTMSWWDGPPPPPPVIDGATVLMTANVRDAVDASGGLHYVRDAFVPGVAYLAVASAPDDEGVALLFCSALWQPLESTRHYDIGGALAQAAFRFGPVTFERFGGGEPIVPRREQR